MKKIIKKVITSLFVLMPFLALTSCEEKAKDITSTCKLTNSFSGKTFESNGIEEATLVRTVDGDTSVFKTVSSNFSFTARYLGINTPESTVGYEKWGKAASVWNNNLMSTEGIKFVVESEGSKPAKDSGGSRYLVYVWYKTPEMSQYQNLNLYTCEMGYSGSTASTDSKYYKYFTKANDLAKQEKRVIWGNDVDVYYSEDVEAVTLKELNENPDLYYDKATSIPKCISFDAYVTEIKKGSNDFKNVTVEEINEDGKIYSYDVTVGYVSNCSALYNATTIGTLLHFVGFPTGDGSIHGVFMLLGHEEGLYSYVIQQDYYQSLSDVNVSSVELNNGVLTITGIHTETKMVTPEGGYNPEKVTITRNLTITITDSTITQTQANALLSKSISFSGYAFDSSNVDQLTVLSYSNIKTK